MQEKRYLAMVLPLDPHTQQRIREGISLDKIRAAVWSETSHALTPLLGSVCSRFAPAMCAWSIQNLRPFGVMLGAVDKDREDMLLCYARARVEQENVLDARTQKIISMGETIMDEAPIDSLNIMVVSIDSRDPEMQKALDLHSRFFSGDITAAAGVYYLGYNRNQLSEDQEMHFLTHFHEYALCTVELHELEVA